jgi:SAM-dependent methyltransferase
MSQARGLSPRILKGLERDGLAVTVERDGTLTITAHGELARRGVDDLRAMMDLIAPRADVPVRVRLDLLKRLLRELPPTNRLRRRSVSPDHYASDEGLAETFLGPPESRWRVDTLAARLRRDGFAITALHPAAAYTLPPFADPGLQAAVDALSPEARCRFAELFWGGDDPIRVTAQARDFELPLWPETGEEDAGRRDALVAAQYEDYPYPERDPEQEPERLEVHFPSNLAEINHYVFGGRRDFARPFRVLVAGGGTGDTTVLLAQQMTDAGVPGEVVYLDMSRASRAIAEARVAKRGLTNVRFVTGSLLDLPALGLSGFDYIDCCGVLHHLESPSEGLRVLADALVPDGGIGMMLYGEIGRVGIYDMQEMLRMIAPAGTMDGEQRIALARALADALPEANWLSRNGLIVDHKRGGKAGIFDLFLHSRDRAYRVPEILALAQSARMRVTGFLEPVLYEPMEWLRDPDIRRRVGRLRPFERATFAELLLGNQKKHIFYLVRVDNPMTLPVLCDEAVPVLRGLDGPTEARRLRPGAAFSSNAHGLKLRLSVPPLGGAIMGEIDGRRSFREIFERLAASDPALTWPEFRRQAQQLYESFHGINRMVLAFPPDRRPPTS